MIKLSIAIAGSRALPSAFVVFRGFERSIEKAAALGFDGVELALKNAGEINANRLSNWLAQHDLLVSCISTGQVYAETGLMFTDSDPNARSKVGRIFREIIDLAADFGQLVNIGRVRGQLSDQHPTAAKNRFMGMTTELCQYAEHKNVSLILEPVNRYEINFINSVTEGAALLRALNLSNLKLMPDTFHMNIEDVNIGNTLANNIADIGYIHFADSNRLAPGQGHIDFVAVLQSLKSVTYQGWVSLEILPKPNPDIAAQQAADYLVPLIKEYNTSF